MGEEHWPPGWYDDPESPGTQRYWDGSNWTGFRLAPSEYGEDAEAGLARLRTRNEARKWAWSAALLERTVAIDNRDAAIKRAREELLATVRGPEQAAYRAKRFKSCTLFAGTIQTPDGEFRLDQGVSARVHEHGNLSVEQGWVFKSSHDARNANLIIEGPDCYSELLVYGGGWSTGDHSAAISNWDYRSRVNQARKFAAAVNQQATIAAAHYAQDREAFNDAEAGLANAAEPERAQLDAAQEHLRQLACQSAEVERDLAHLSELRGRLRGVRDALNVRKVEGALRKELNQYGAVESLVLAARVATPAHGASIPLASGGLDDSTGAARADVEGRQSWSPEELKSRFELLRELR
jgi:hypothetical protein